MTTNKSWTIYKHTNKINDKSYIGITSKKPSYRWNNGYGYSTQKVFANAIKKYGWENFTHEIIESNIKTLAEANAKEQYWIIYYHTWLGDPNCNGYNKTPGGDSKLGKTYSESGKQKLSAKRRGIPKSAQHKLHIGQGNRGKVRTPEMKLKLSLAKKGIPSKRPHSSFVEAAHKKAIKCVENGIIYQSISEAAKKLQLCTSGISAQLHNKQKTVKGYTFIEIS